MEQTIYYCDGCGESNLKPYINHVGDKIICNSCQSRVDCFVELIKPYDHIYDNNGYIAGNIRSDVIWKSDSKYEVSTATLLHNICKVLDIDYKDKYLYEERIPTKEFLYDLLMKLSKIF